MEQVINKAVFCGVPLIVSGNVAFPGHKLEGLKLGELRYTWRVVDGQIMVDYQITLDAITRGEVTTTPVP